MQTEFISKIKSDNLPQEGSTSAKSASNIALVKYWGKKENQIPTNASISFTLTNSYTQTKLIYTKQIAEEFNVRVLFDGREEPNFVSKIIQFFNRIEAFVPFLKYYSFVIETNNTFPHSSGIASSASGMSALALCLLQMEQDFGANYNLNYFKQKASFLARLGSGSAARSIYNGLAVWGKHPKVAQSSDLYAVPILEKVHPVYSSFYDVILLVHEGEKSVSSSVGHGLMENHPYAIQRFTEANNNLSKMIGILQTNNLAAFGQLVEHEALSLHAMMLTSSPAYILMQPNTMAIIQKIWQFRQYSQAHLYFTLDAGANVHLLFPAHDKELIMSFIQHDLAKYCQNGKYIVDHVSKIQTKESN